MQTFLSLSHHFSTNARLPDWTAHASTEQGIVQKSRAAPLFHELGD